MNCSFLNRLEDNSRQKQFEKIVLQMKEHMQHSNSTLYISQKEKLTEVRQFHHRADDCNMGTGR
ncbi:hypothetical protein AV654_13265 [Paenibacillus elgii]|uniref:Uncharacterized protein n=1 Tax=Paenibacillus elgii TaxID=189691 RepID=A0A165R9N9_9BACL|nr:hypothetical protein AV654_13265 [Paenibacillus elgii]